MPIEAESPEQFGYDRIRFNLAESSVADTPLRDLDVSLDDLVLLYGDHLGRPGLRAAIAAGADGVTPDDVLVTPGAAAALFIISTTPAARPATTSSSPARTTRRTSRRRSRSGPTSATWTCATRTAGRSIPSGSPR